MLSRQVLTLAQNYLPVGSPVPVDAAGIKLFDLIL